MALFPPTAKAGDMRKVVPISEGGTGASTAAQAIANLQGIALASKNLPGGPLALDASGKTTFDFTGMQMGVDVTVDGPVSTHVGTDNKFTITNYHTQTDYVVTTTNGTITRRDDTITFTPTEAGNSGFTINGKIFPVVVRVGLPGKPLPLYPVSYANNVSQQAQLAAGPFTAVAPGDTMLNADWQISTSPTFATIAFQSLANAAFSASQSFYSTPDLTAGTTYYWRVRYRGTLGEVSEWSDTQQFTTMAVFVATTTYAMNTQGNAITGEQVGRSLAISQDGLHCVVGIMGRNSGRGGYVIWNRPTINSAWTEVLFYEMPVTTENAGARMGYRCTMSLDGTRCAIGAPTYLESSPNGTGIGGVHVLRRSGTTWTLEAFLRPIAANSSAWCGGALHFDNDGTRLVVGSFADNYNSISLSGRVYVYSRSGTTWSIEATINPSEATADGLFGNAVAISATGDRIVIAQPARNYTTPTVRRGDAFIYTRSGTTWTLHSKLSPPVRGANENFGVYLHASTDLSVIAVGNRYLGYTPTEEITAGSVDVFVLSGNVWGHEERITPPDGVALDQFGNFLQISNGGTRLYVASPNATRNGVAQVGKVYIFTRNAATASWSFTALMHNLQPYDVKPNAYFGNAIGLTAGAVQAVVSANGHVSPGIAAGVVFTCK